jgi:uncharacterized protein YecE (DUF72 family)
MKRKFHIGTSGWNYKHWKGRFYPADLKEKEWLSYYSKHFDITEINSSFYHMPTEKTVLNWAATVKKKFMFCPKISRYITHMKKLNDPEEPVEYFFKVFDHMHDHLGPVLVQLPRMVTFKPEKTEHFYSLLRDRYREYAFAMEIRHDSWLTKESIDLMKKYNMSFVISQSGGYFPYEELVTAKDIYVRFHGPTSLYSSNYTDAMLKKYAKMFTKWIKDGHVVWAFFNNDVPDHAPRNALRLKEIMEDMAG